MAANKKRDGVASARQKPDTRGGLPALLFLAVLVAFHADDLLGMWSPSGVTSSTGRIYVVGNIPLRDVALLACALMAIVFRERIIAVVGSRFLFPVICALALYSIVGVVAQNQMAEMRGDFRILGWFFGGMVLGELYLMMPQKIGVLEGVLIGCLPFMVIAFNQAGSEVATDQARITHPTIFLLSASVYSILALLIEESRKNRAATVLLLVGIGICAYLMVVRGLTRSVLAVLLCLVVCWALSWSMGHGRGWGFFVIAAVGLGIVITASEPTWLGEAAADSPYQRLMENPFDENNAENRLEEIRDFFQQASWKRLVLGSGVGGWLYSSVYGGEKTAVMHVGIFNFWLKFGIIPFAALAVILYVYLPVRYWRAIKGTQGADHEELAVERAVLPVFLTWATMLAMSGGFSEVNLLWAGLAFYVYRDLAVRIESRNPVADRRRQARGRGGMPPPTGPVEPV